MPGEYINARSNGITQACLDYILPLIQGETKIEYFGGLPKHYIIEK